MSETKLHDVPWILKKYLTKMLVYAKYCTKSTFT